MPRIWHKDLFEVNLIPYYGVNLLCPWAAMYQLLDKLLYDKVIIKNKCYFIHPMNAAHSFFTCQLPCCLATRSAWKYLTAKSPNDDDDDDEQQQPQTPVPSTWFTLPHEMTMLPIHHEEEDEEETIPSEMLTNSTLSIVCMGMMCMLPTMCWIRHAVDQKYHEFTENKESMWQTGLITCLAWPCSLTQLSGEIDYYDNPE